jgi:hypothetical protein
LAGVLATVLATGAFGAVLCRGALFRAALFGAALAAILEAEFFAPVAFAPVLVAFGGIALLLFFEDLAAVVALAALRDVRARLLEALRLPAAPFFEVLEVLFLRVFCDTACARNCHAPVRCFFAETLQLNSKRVNAADRFSSEFAEYSTFSAKINDLAVFRAVFKRVGRY